MKQIKLIIKTNSKKYPIIIGYNLLKNLSKIFEKNSISFNQCLLIIDENVPIKMDKKKKFKKKKKKKKKKKYLDTTSELMRKIKI